MMKKLLLIFEVLIILLSSLWLITSLEADVSVTRDLSNFQVGEEFEVILEITISDSVVAIGLREYLPTGGNIINCSEEHYKIEGNNIEILLFDSNKAITTKNVTYNVILSSNNAVFSGTWQSVEPNLTGSISNIFQLCGDGDCSIDETCSSCPGDCGTCSSGESSGGGGGGSSSGESFKGDEGEVSSKTEDEEVSKEQNLGESGEIEGTKDTGLAFFRNMGNVITDIFSDEEGKITWISITILVFIILGILILTCKRFYPK